MRIVFVSATLVFAVAAACRSPARGAPGPPPDPRRCAVALLPGETTEERAVRCAEWFIVRNGYTTRRPAESAQLALDTGEVAGTTAEQLARRRGMLREGAVVVCREPQDDPPRAFVVGFAYRPDPPSPTGRAVTMDSAFGRIHLDPRDFPLVTALGDTANCRGVAALMRRQVRDHNLTSR